MRQGSQVGRRGERAGAHVASSIREPGNNLAPV